MPHNESQNLNFKWSTAFVRALYNLGIKEVVISPGSRSTSLTLAFAAHPGFRKHICIDERSAGFQAMGLAKGTGIPAVLVCTSGTAVANYLPAVIEASQTNIPLLVLSADRPPSLRGIGASQTIDQLKIFGHYPVFFHETGLPDERNESLARLKVLAEQAIFYATQKQGVSHLNFPFHKPFEPTAEYLETVEQENEKQAKKSYSLPKTTVISQQLAPSIQSQIEEAEAPIIIAGNSISQKLGQTISELAKLLNAPVLVEPGANIPLSKHTIIGFDGFLRNPEILDTQEPDLILRFGGAPVSKAVSSYLTHFSGVPHLRFFEGELFADETLTAHQFVPLHSGLDVSEFKAPMSINKEWMRSWRRLYKAYSSFRETLMYPTTPLTDGYVFHQMAPLIPTRSFTMLSNSFPARDLALFGEYDGREIYLNRGAAGIDGILSTTIGLSKSLDKPGVLFIGDIAFLHDSNALLNLKEVTQPLLIIVLNNGGGTIFKMLPVNSFKKKYANYFLTPQLVSLAALCRAHKLPHSLVSRPEQVISAFEQNIEKPGAHIIECITDGEDSMELRKALWNYEPILE